MHVYNCYDEASCLSYAAKAFEIGTDIYMVLQKPYSYSTFQISTEE